MKKRITPAQRRRQDYLRRKGLKVGEVYVSRLKALRRREVRRVLGVCMDTGDVSAWPRIIENELSEAGYIYDWHTGLYLQAGLPNAKSVARDLSRGKADNPSGIWEREIRAFAQERAGHNVVSLSGTLRNALISLLEEEIEQDINRGVESLSKAVFSRFNGELLEWQCRRIAQTETMVALAESGNSAAKSLDVAFTKEWCISGVGNTRDSHAAMDGVVVDEDDFFEVEGEEGQVLMLYPHDGSMGAPAGEIINCACSCIRMPK